MTIEQTLEMLKLLMVTGHTDVKELKLIINKGIKSFLADNEKE